MKRYFWLVFAFSSCGGSPTSTNPDETVKEGGTEMDTSPTSLCCELGPLGQERCEGRASLAAGDWACEGDASCGVDATCATPDGVCTGTVTTCP